MAKTKNNHNDHKEQIKDTKKDSKNDHRANKRDKNR